MPKIQEITDFLNHEGYLLYGDWDPESEITGVAQHWNAKSGDIAWTLEKSFDNFKGDLLLLPQNAEIIENSILCINVKLAFIKVLQKFFKSKSESVFGINSILYGIGTVIDNVVPGKNVTIGANCSIGAEGFGHEKDKNGIYQRFPHFGKIIIGDNVEIGSNVTIQRGTIGDTIIGNNVRIWHQANIGHNCIIGKNSVILNGAILCGSIQVEACVWIAPGATILNKVQIGNDAVIGPGAVVTKDVPRKTIVGGNPARVLGKVDESTHIMRSHRR